MFDASFLSGPQMQHNVAWEGCWRDLSPLNRSTAFAVREHAGHTLKSSVRHILTCDRRDSPVFPSVGSLIRMTQG
jgi:outer membrane protein insertion porin family